LYIEANEPSLENRRIKLGMQYATKLKALCCVSSKSKVGFGFNYAGFSGITMGAMSSKFISKFSKCVFTRSPKG
jgi:vacuolar-type H+-ATPase subunit I/STV1